MTATMNIISMTLLIAMSLILAPGSDAFFWSCPALEADDTVSNKTAAWEKMTSMFPAFVYLKKGDDGEKVYSCITIEMFDDYQAPPPPPPEESRFFCIFGCNNQEEEPKAYNATITYYAGGQQEVAYSNMSIWEDGDALVVTLTETPSKLFGERSGKTKLRLASMGEDYFILIDCNNYFLSFGHTKYSYMFMSTAADMDALMAMDWRCLAAGLEDATDTSGILPGGVCSGGEGTRRALYNRISV